MTTTETMIWQRILAARKRAAGRAAPSPKDRDVALLDSRAFGDPIVDEGAMFAYATITTATPDRSEDIVEPTGVLLDSYRKNPVVMWDHGLGGLTLPIGKCEDPDGNLALSITDEGIDACCYFAQNMYEACQIFELIVQKIIRATSIGFRPLEAEPRTKGLDRPGLHITLWELFEWSWVVVPDNPDAIAKVLDVGKLAGRAICEPILKSLSPLKPKRRFFNAAAVSPGWRPPGGKSLEDYRQIGAAMRKKQEAVDECNAAMRDLLVSTAELMVAAYGKLAEKLRAVADGQKTAGESQAGDDGEPQPGETAAPLPDEGEPCDDKDAPCRR